MRSPWLLADVVLLLAALPVLAVVGYLVALSVLAWSTPATTGATPTTRFVIVIPAHDEVGLIGATVASVRAVDYPASLRRVLVVADNCGDDTAARARAAGAEVLERVDPLRRGKGHALAHAFAALVHDGETDAVVVVDADTVVSPALLRALARRFERGEQALQARYGVRNPEASWRTRLMAISLAAYHDVRSLGRERLGLSCGLRGNGMALSTALLRAIPHVATSLVEDVEHGLQLGLAGHRVGYVHDAEVQGEMATGAVSSASQRRRWEAGRAHLARTYVGPLLARAFRRADPVALDLAVDLLVPPLALVALTITAGLAASVALALMAQHASWSLVAWSVCAVGLTAHALRGWQRSRTGLGGLVALAHVPGYVLWKLSLPFRRGAAPAGTWVRTARESGGR